MTRPRILALGVSYTDMDRYIDYAAEAQRWNEMESQRRLRRQEKEEQEPTSLVTKVLECMSKNQINAMDGRDTCRCIAVEEYCNVDVYTVSQERGALYRKDRHLHANFNRSKDLMQALIERTPMQFQEIILDYFWIPAGWDTQHWHRSFFENTLADFHRLHVLKLPNKTEQGGNVYLPFCHYVFKRILACRKVLLRYYNVEFVRELDEIQWWRGTQQIDHTVMQRVLHKRIDQENVYCRFGLKTVLEAEHDSQISKKQILDTARQIEDFGKVRFVKLVPLTEAESQSSKVLGKIKGLKNPSKVARGIDQVVVEDVATEQSVAVKKTTSSQGIIEKPRKRGRPRKIVEEAQVQRPRKRGRPKKVIATTVENSSNPVGELKPKRKRGRPRKVPLCTSAAALNDDVVHKESERLDELAVQLSSASTSCERVNIKKSATKEEAVTTLQPPELVAGNALAVNGELEVIAGPTLGRKPACGHEELPVSVSINTNVDDCLDTTTRMVNTEKNQTLETTSLELYRNPDTVKPVCGDVRGNDGGIDTKKLTRGASAEVEMTNETLSRTAIMEKKDDDAEVPLAAKKTEKKLRKTYEKYTVGRIPNKKPVQMGHESLLLREVKSVQNYGRIPRKKKEAPTGCPLELLAASRPGFQHNHQASSAGDKLAVNGNESSVSEESSGTRVVSPAV